MTYDIVVVVIIMIVTNTSSTGSHGPAPRRAGRRDIRVGRAGCLAGRGNVLASCRTSYNC